MTVIIETITGNLCIPVDDNAIKEQLEKMIISELNGNSQFITFSTLENNIFVNKNNIISVKIK